MVAAIDNGKAAGAKRGVTIKLRIGVQWHLKVTMMVNGGQQRQ